MFVKLADFRAWGESLPQPFDFPNEFPRAMSPAPSATQQASVEQERPLRPDSRTNLLRVIRALYEKANLREHESVGTIEQMIQSLGFDGPGDDTIRSILREARLLKPDHSPQ